MENIYNANKSVLASAQSTKSRILFKWFCRKNFCFHLRNFLLNTELVFVHFHLPAEFDFFFFLLSRRLSVNKFAAIPFNLHDPRIIKNVNFLGTFLIPPRFILLKNNGQVERFYNRSRKKWAAQSSYFYNFYKDFPCIKIKHHKAVVEFVSQDKL